MADWETEIRELHEFFEAYFLGTSGKELDRVEAALGSDFTMCGPSGDESDRKATIKALKDGFAHTLSLRIEIADPELLFDDAHQLIAAYTEIHHLADRSNYRRSTVIFGHDPDAPNGLRWIRVHESWIDRGLSA